MVTCLLCAKCCEQTEMLLANEDVRRIEMYTNLSRRKFSFLKDGYFYLKNKKRYCVFLDHETRKCSIYKTRPIGCRYYPIIYNPFLNKCVVDKECTNKKNISNKMVEKFCPDLQEFILLLEKERNKRLNLKI